MKFSLILSALVLLVSCSNSTKTAEQEKKRYEVKKPSEMALHMNFMYAYNEGLKKQIEAGEMPADFPQEFLNIHTAVLTDSTGRNETFKKYAVAFVEETRTIFDTLSSVPLTKRYNNAIGMCITCHKTECVGPIPRIKKLIIPAE